MFVLEPEGTLLQILSSSWGRCVGEFTFTPEEVIHRGTSTVEYIAWGAIAPCRVNRPEDYYILLGPTYFVMCLTFTHPLHYTPMQGLYYCCNLLHKAKKMHIRHTSTTNCITHCHIGMCTHITRAHTSMTVQTS